MAEAKAFAEGRREAVSDWHVLLCIARNNGIGSDILDYLGVKRKLPDAASLLLQLKGNR